MSNRPPSARVPSLGGNTLRVNAAAARAVSYECISGTTIPRVSTETVPVSSINFSINLDQQKRKIISKVNIDGSDALFTTRFGNSFLGLLGQSKSIYTLYDPVEIIERAVERKVAKGQVQVTFAFRKDGTREVLAVVNETTPIVQVERLIEFSDDFQTARYDDGQIRSHHAPNVHREFDVFGDKFETMTAVFTPLDGYGAPSSYLAMIRQICTNGMVAMSSVFRSVLTSSKTSPHSRVIQFLNGVGENEQHDYIIGRMQIAAVTRASAYETLKLAQVLDRSGCPDLAHALWNLSGIAREYGLTAANAVPQKIAQRCPTDISVYDLFNFATEVATHSAPSEHAARVVSGIVGDLFAEEGSFDLEGVRVLDTPTTGTAFLLN